MKNINREEELLNSISHATIQKKTDSFYTVSPFVIHFYSWTVVIT